MITRMPLNRCMWQATADSNSFSYIDYLAVGEIPVGPHCGAFGHVRTNHTHEGIDLYGNTDDTVYSMNDGVVIWINPLTGEQVGSPWWHNTLAIGVFTGTHTWVYGEVAPLEHIEMGTVVKSGDALAKLVPVLKKDKGRPMTMLHVELYDGYVPDCIRTWPTDAPLPPGNLIDPTPYLLKHIEDKYEQSSS